MFAWKESYAIGVKEIDAQHKHLFKLAEDLHAAMNAGKATAALQEVFTKLVAYTKTHFAAEERLMQKCGYSGFAAHKAKHDELTQKVVDLQQKFQAGTAMLSVETMQFLSQWLQHHIGGTDRQYVPFVAGRGELAAIR